MARSVHDQNLRRARAAAVPPGIRREIKCLQTDFANDLSIDELADQAQLSRSYFRPDLSSCTSNKDHKDCKRPSFLYEQDRARRLCPAAKSVAYLPRLRAGFWKGK